MPDTAGPDNTHHHRTRSHRSSANTLVHTGLLEPVFYFTGAIVMLIIARLMHLDMAPLVPAALGIIVLAVSKNWRLSAGVPVSMLLILVMIAASVVQWAGRYFGVVLSGEIASNTVLFVNGFTEGLILAVLLWTYHRLFRSVHYLMGKKWFVKRMFVHAFKLAYYFQLLLFLFWTIAYILYKAQPLTRLAPEDTTMISGATALLAAGIPAIIYLSKKTFAERHRHHHGHHHRHYRSRHSPGIKTD